MTEKNLYEMPVFGTNGMITYAVTGLNMLAATLSAQGMLSQQTTVTAIALNLLGLPLSVYFSHRNYNRMLLNILIMAPLLILTFMLIQDLPGMDINWSDPWESFLSHETSDNLVLILHVLVIIAAGRALTLVTQRDLLQTAIPSVSIFIMSAIIPAATLPYTHDPLMLFYLLTLAITSLYLLTLTHNQLWFSSAIPFKIQRQLIIWVLIISLTAFPLVVVTGASLERFNIISMAKYQVRHPFLRFHLPFIKDTPAIGFSNSIDMGSSDWPTGDQIVMRVQVKRGQSLLYRSTTYDHYSEGKWRKSEYSRQRFSMSVLPVPGKEVSLITLKPDSSQSDPGIAQAILEKKISLNQNELNDFLAKQIFTILAPGIGNDFPIYGAFQIQSIAIPASSAPIVSVGNDGGISFSENSPNSSWLDRYEVSSIIKPSPTHLRLDKPLKLEDAAETSYLQIPAEIKWQLHEKAMTILKERHLTLESNPLKIVSAFEAYLGKNFRYTLKPSQPKNGADPILDFLLTQKKGYCTYFSGAMVMLCRSVKIPARMVVGFASGKEISPETHDDVTQYEVAEKDAHSWTEIFLPSYGWYTSDPTAGSAEALGFSGNLLEALYEIGNGIKTSVSNLILTIKHSALSRTNPILIFVLLLCSIIGLLFLRRERPQAFPQRELSPIESKEQILRSYQQMLRWLKRWGVSKPAGSTATEFQGYFHQLSPAMGETVGELSNLYIKAQYDMAAIDDLEARHSIVLLHQLWAHLHHKHKFQLEGGHS